MKIGLFYGSDMGATEEVATKIALEFLEFEVEVMDIYDASKEDFLKFDKIILGVSTWDEGDLQSDWKDFYKKFKKIDFSNTCVALFGLGDQIGYGHTFVDGMGKLAKRVLKNGGNIEGCTSNAGYCYSYSKAEIEKGSFVGLAIDQDNQPELTQQRIVSWCSVLSMSWSKRLAMAS